MSRRLLLTVSLVIVFMTRDASAHFLFVRITPPAEAGRAAEVYFSEIARAGDPTFIDKIAHTKLWSQTKPGVWEPLVVRKATDRLRACLPMHGSVVVAGECTYGVIARDKQTPFLLRHFPKAMAGSSEQLNQMRPRPDALFEIVASVNGDQIRFVALRGGKPVPGVVFTTVDDELTNEEFSADGDGQATWSPAKKGHYSVYAPFVSKESGEFSGKRFDEIRDFATLAFSWPLDRRGPDADAVSLFETALANRAAWKDFPGFTAKIRGAVDGRPFEGTVTLDSAGAVAIKTQEPMAEDWVAEQLESIAMHRGARSSSGSAGQERAKPVLQFADEDSTHPLGRLLAFHGGSFASSYRVRDQQIMVVNRQIGSSNMTITVLVNDRNADGHFLPQCYTVQYWDSTSGQPQRTETIQDSWQRRGAWDLPRTHIVTTASESGLSVRYFTLTELELRPSN